ncbi:hypothetical protein ABPG74_009328 [Tetrahymena malaccensis]
MVQVYYQVRQFKPIKFKNKDGKFVQNDNNKNDGDDEYSCFQMDNSCLVSRKKIQISIQQVIDMIHSENIEFYDEKIQITEDGIKNPQILEKNNDEKSSYYLKQNSNNEFVFHIQILEPIAKLKYERYKKQYEAENQIALIRQVQKDKKQEEKQSCLMFVTALPEDEGTHLQTDKEFKMILSSINKNSEIMILKRFQQIQNHLQDNKVEIIHFGTHIKKIRKDKKETQIDKFIDIIHLEKEDHQLEEVQLDKINLKDVFEEVQLYLSFKYIQSPQAFNIEDLFNLKQEKFQCNCMQLAIQYILEKEYQQIKKQEKMEVLLNHASKFIFFHNKKNQECQANKDELEKFSNQKTQKKIATIDNRTVIFKYYEYYEYYEKKSGDQGIIQKKNIEGIKERLRRTINQKPFGVSDTNMENEKFVQKMYNQIHKILFFYLQEYCPFYRYILNQPQKQQLVSIDYNDGYPHIKSGFVNFNIDSDFIQNNPVDFAELKKNISEQLQINNNPIVQSDQVSDQINNQQFAILDLSHTYKTKQQIQMCLANYYENQFQNQFAVEFFPTQKIQSKDQNSHQYAYDIANYIKNNITNEQVSKKLKDKKQILHVFVFKKYSNLKEINQKKDHSNLKQLLIESIKFPDDFLAIIAIIDCINHAIQAGLTSQIQEQLQNQKQTFQQKIDLYKIQGIFQNEKDLSSYKNINKNLLNILNEANKKEFEEQTIIKLNHSQHKQLKEIDIGSKNVSKEIIKFLARKNLINLQIIARQESSQQSSLQQQIMGSQSSQLQQLIIDSQQLQLQQQNKDSQESQLQLQIMEYFLNQNQFKFQLLDQNDILIYQEIIKNEIYFQSDIQIKEEIILLFLSNILFQPYKYSQTLKYDKIIEYIQKYESEGLLKNIKYLKEMLQYMKVSRMLKASEANPNIFNYSFINYIQLNKRKAENSESQDILKILLIQLIKSVEENVAYNYASSKDDIDDFKNSKQEFKDNQLELFIKNIDFENNSQNLHIDINLQEGSEYKSEYSLYLSQLHQDVKGYNVPQHQKNKRKNIQKNISTQITPDYYSDNKNFNQNFQNESSQILNNQLLSFEENTPLQYSEIRKLNSIENYKTPNDSKIERVKDILSSITSQPSKGGTQSKISKSNQQQNNIQFNNEQIENVQGQVYQIGDLNQNNCILDQNQIGCEVKQSQEQNQQNTFQFNNQYSEHVSGDIYQIGDTDE